jgi:protein SCO1/2
MRTFRFDYLIRSSARAPLRFTVDRMVSRLRCPSALIGLVVLVLSGCGPKPKPYALHGQVIAITPDRRVLTIKHDDIQGFMSAMTMPYEVTEPSITKDLVVGDVIDATLLVFESGVPKLSTITRTGHAPVPADAPAPLTGILQPGDVVPDNALQDLYGATRRLTDWQGHAVAVTFVYTRCPMPDFCPLMDRQFAAVQRALLADRALASAARLISISFDPEHDTPAVLEAHAREIGADPRIWTLLTGASPNVQAVTSAFGVSVIHDQMTPQALTHNLRTAVLDPRGRLVKIYDGHDWTPEMLLSDLRDARGR